MKCGEFIVIFAIVISIVCALPSCARAEVHDETWSISDYTFIENRTLELHNGTTIEPGGTLVLVNATVIVSGTFLVKEGGRLEVTNSVFSGDYRMRIAGSALLTSSKFSGMTGTWDASGIQIFSSNVSLVGCDVVSKKAQTISAIMCISSSPSISDSNIHDSGLGIRLSSSSAKISGCTFKNNIKGISSVDSSPEISRCAIESSEEVGIGLFSSGGKVGQCILSDNKVGIECASNTTTEIASNIISGSQIGIRLEESHPSLSQNAIERCSEGVSAYYSAPSLSGNKFSNCTEAYHAIGTLPPSTFNSFSELSHNSANVLQSWMLTLRVEDTSGNPLVAHIEARDANGRKAFEGDTRTDGLVYLQLDDRQYSPDESFNPYKVTFSKSGKSDKFTIKVTTNLEKKVALDLSDDSLSFDASYIVIAVACAFALVVCAGMFISSRKMPKKKKKGKNRRKK